jgi:Reverse transcriptase (RNA-dependent DNA polymerase)
MSIGTPIPVPKLNAADLLLRGLFHDRLIPPLSSVGLGPAIADIFSFAKNDIKDVNGRKVPRIFSRCSRHSVPKQKLARRFLAIPNPRNQIHLAIEIEENWDDLLSLCRKSAVSLTTPSLIGKRAIQGAIDRRSEASERAKRSVGLRYVLHADIARFYPSIYTHSIPWAIHGKATARADKANALFGNRLDQWIRATQDKQTGGIPVGPDSSFLLAEVLASAIDHELSKVLDEDLKGTRFIDDYHLYFPARANAERALAGLHRIAGEFELEINGLKTQIEELPESIDPGWKTQLRVITVSEGDHATSLKALFDRAAELARDFPRDNVFTYLVKKVETAVGKVTLQDSEWEALDALLLRAAVAEPGALPTILRIFEHHSRNPEDVDKALESICLYHASLQQAGEVAWALWTAKRLGVALSTEVANAVETVDDDIVALVALELHASDLLPTPVDQFSLWAGYMTQEQLYSDHWLLAYEAFEQGWLPSKDGKHYVGTDEYFQVLKKHSVKFYDTSADVEEPDSGYNDDDDNEDSDLDEEDDDESPDVEAMSPEDIEKLMEQFKPTPPTDKI